MIRTRLLCLLAALWPSIAAAQSPLPNPLVIGPNTVVGRGNTGVSGLAYAMSFQEFLGALQTLGLATAQGTAGGDLSGTYPNPTVAKLNGTAPPNSGLFKGNGAGGAVAATSGTDYAPATSGSSLLKGNGAGGFSNAVASTDFAPVTTGSSILKANGIGGFANAVASTDYAPVTSGSAILKGNGVGGFSSAVLGTDYAPATSGSAILKGNGAGGFASAVLGTDYSNLTNATTQGSVASPAATASTTGVMMGLGATCKITPVYSTRVHIFFTGNLSNTTSGSITEAILKFGTGTAPTNGAAFSGTTIASAKDYTASAANSIAPVTLQGIVTGLTPATAYWFDVDLLVSANTGSIAKVDCAIMEF